MRRVFQPISLGSLALLVSLLLTSPALSQDAAPTGSTITLNGELTRVRWSDGDSFRILDGQYADTGVRLGGYNSLESYGPVHRWGDWTGQELYDFAYKAGDFARAGTWTCTTGGETDRYDRLLIACDGLTTAIVAAGLGHLVAISAPASPDAVAAQAAARRLQLGIWAKGVPDNIVTSLHSADEGGDRIYNRVISTTDGSSTEVVHEETFAVCQEVCINKADGAEDSCLVYVPYEQRYGNNRAACLRPNTDQAGQ